MLTIVRIALAGLFAGSALAQSNAGLPSCAANGCVTSDYGGCESLDIECICTRGAWIADLACCVSQACDAAGQEATIQFANAICGSVGAADALPTTATCAATASSTSAPSSSTPTSSETPSGTTPPTFSTTPASNRTTTTTEPTSSGTSTVSASAPAQTTEGGSGASACQAQGLGLVLGLAGLLAVL